MIGNNESELNEERIRELIARGKKFTGKKLGSDTEKMYKEILKFQEDQISKFGIGHKSSLTNSVRNYGKLKDCEWKNSEEKKRSITESIRSLIKKGKLSK